MARPVPRAAGASDLSARSSRRRPGDVPTGGERSAASYLEVREWIIRSRQRCQCAATARFLEMIEGRISERLRELDRPVGGDGSLRAAGSEPTGDAP